VKEPDEFYGSNRRYSKDNEFEDLCPKKNVGALDTTGPGFPYGIGISTV